MRAIITSALLFTLGALAMNTAAIDAQEKKEEFPELVTVKRWDAQGKQFINPVENVKARRKDTKKGLMFDLKAPNGNAIPDKGSHIIDKDGNVYEITEAEAPPIGLFVKLVKAAPKPDKKP